MTMQVANLLLGNFLYLHASKGFDEDLRRRICILCTRADGAIRFKRKTFETFISNSHVLLGEYVLSSPSSETCLYLLQISGINYMC